VESLNSFKHTKIDYFDTTSRDKIKAIKYNKQEYFYIFFTGVFVTPLTMEFDASELRRLKQAAVKYTRDIEKNERWECIAKEVGRSKKECYNEYRALKNERKKEPVCYESKQGVPTSNVMQVEEVEDFEQDDIQNISARLRGKSCDKSFSRDKSISVSKIASRGGRHISKEEMLFLKSILFTGRRVLDASWREQGFHYSKNQTYGLVQNKGGPCGVLAVVQAYVLKYLLFNAVDWEHPTKEEQQSALVSAVTEIVWQSGPNGSCVLALHTTVPHPEGYSLQAAGVKLDGCFDKMQLFTVTTQRELEDLVQKHLAKFCTPCGFGVAMLLLSVIISRGVNTKMETSVLGDVDTAMGGEIALIGSHNYATQELVNLFLVGVASSNVFDGDKYIGESKSECVKLRGIHSRSDIGFLTLFEHFEYMEVGTHLKSPMFPIWVICSESHYSVLFSDDKDVVKQEDFAFDLIYYDPLGCQDEVYRLTVNPDPARPVEKCLNEKTSLIPPLENCIRTKWPGATVDWNGSEKLL